MNERDNRERSVGEERDEREGENRKNKQPETTRNPKGAGRPSREVTAKRKIEEFTSNPERWLREHAPEFLDKQYRGDKRPDAKSASGGKQRIFKGLARGILGTIGFRKKEIDRLNIDAFDELADMAINELKPSKAPALWRVIGIAGGLIGWYWGEEKWIKEEKINLVIWNSWSEATRNKYIYYVEFENHVIAYKQRLPQALHTAELMLRYVLDMIGNLVGFFSGVDDFFEERINRMKEGIRQINIDNGTFIPLEETGYVVPDVTDVVPEPEDLADLAYKSQLRLAWLEYSASSPSTLRIPSSLIDGYVERGEIPPGYFWVEEKGTFMTQEQYDAWQENIKDVEEYVEALPDIEPSEEPQEPYDPKDTSYDYI